jgi:flagellin
MLKGQGIDWSASFAGNQTGAQILAGFGNETLLVTDGTGTGASGLTLQIGDTNESHQKVTVAVDNLSSDGLGINGLDVSTQEAAGSAIASIKSAINKVSTNRANLGGLQNRLEHTINNLSVTEENMTAAEARIRDVDMAKEMMAYTKNNVLTQAAQAMLAQANTQPQSVLQLLQ